ncbi:MAG: cytochrome c oxidase subunit [Thermoleophilaceae bacterium]|nr:cytochrome c oxidase subunit [Thermoleophilaceae bacterium]
MRAVPSLTRSRTAFLAALAMLALALLLAPGALATDYFTPRSGGGSPNAESIDTLYKVAFGIGILIFLLVEGVLVYSLVKFRHRRGGPEPAQIRGNTPLEVGWTVGAAVILLVLTVVTFVFLGDIRNPAKSQTPVPTQAAGTQFASIDQKPPPGPPQNYLRIKVNGQQYLWRYDYPTKQQVFSYYDMVVPVNTTVLLSITASDVIHSWWVPDFGGKADAVPGYTNKTWFRVKKTGTYVGACAELCGENHADMRNRVIVVTPEQYRAWLTQQATDIKAAQTELAASRKTRPDSQ